jgi:hypothetical protein
MSTMVEVQEQKLFIIKQVALMLEEMNRIGEGHAYQPESKYELVGGKKYLKIAKGNYVHSFVDAMNGDVYKPAGWQAPAKGARYNIASAEGLEELVRNFDSCGSYLYSHYRKV